MIFARNTLLSHSRYLTIYARGFPHTDIDIIVADVSKVPVAFIIFSNSPSFLGLLDPEDEHSTKLLCCLKGEEWHEQVGDSQSPFLQVR
jgi:hypothetical protein